MNKFAVALLGASILAAPAVAQTAAPQKPAPQAVAADPPATLDNVWDAERRTNKLLEGVQADVAAIRATMPSAAGKKSAIVIDFSSAPIDANPTVAAATTVYCRSINYSFGKSIWSSGTALLRIVCYD